MISYYLTFHILIGFYAVDWYCLWFSGEAEKVGEQKHFNPKEVIAIYIFWPVVIPLLLIVFYWPIKTPKGERDE